MNEKITYMAAVIADLVNRMSTNPHPSDLNACVCVAVTNLRAGKTGATAYGQALKLANSLFTHTQPTTL